MAIVTKRLATAVLLVSIVAWSGVTTGKASGNNGGPKRDDDRMSGMGLAASRARAKIAAEAASPSPRVIVGRDLQDDEDCVNELQCGTGFRDGPAGTQSETSIAVDSTGQHVVIGFNDFRGFANNPVSVSGFMYSDDGGATFVDGGQLPSPGIDTIGTARLPQVFGDPDVKYLGDCTFFYSSIILKKFSATQAVQTLGVHRSTDCGHTWAGPFEVTAATNPNGGVVGGVPQDDADKEFMDVDPDTGRVMVSWTNFTPAETEMSTTYSDNLLSANPTWSPRRVVSKTDADGQSSVPRFAGRGSSNVYIAWWRVYGGLADNIGFARSTNNGATWSSPIEISPSHFFFMDHVLGNDRVHVFPSLAVDNSPGGHTGNIYVVYATNDSSDGADIAFQRSSDEGLSFSEPILLNSRPGDDRAQWFPWVSVDSWTGRIHVFYYDQGIASSGDLTEVTHTFSDDGGETWKQPLPLTSRPFHAGWGNDTSQPNLGDYNQSVAQDGDLFVVYAEATRPPAGFTDGQPTSASLTVPDVVVRRLSTEDHKFKAASLNIAAVSAVDSGGNGFLDPGDIVRVDVSLRNFVTNPLNAARVRGVEGALTTTTPGVVILQADSHYKNVEPGDTETNIQDFVLKLEPSFVPGTPIELALEITSAEHGAITLLHTLFTGTPLATTLLSENFNAGAPGWTTAHGGGVNVVPWTLTNSFCGATSPAAFHQNAADGPATGPFTNTRWERLFSPTFTVPGNAEYVTVDMDVCYDTEDDPNFDILAYDGFFLRVLDATAGRLLRSVLVEAFADEFTTGSLFHYPKHLPRSSNTAYFQDMSAWAGDSHGYKHVRLRLPGMAGSAAQLRFEYTQDSIAVCSDVRPGHTCGVAVDNVVVRSVRSVVP